MYNKKITNNVMNTIKKIFLFLAVVLTAGVQMSCTDYQDEIDALDYRVTVLENLVKTINRDLDALQKAVNALGDEIGDNPADYITNVSRTPENDGYIITFHKAGAVIVRDGKDGVDGQDGADAVAPTITLDKAPDGKFYWKIITPGNPTGTWILDEYGDKVCANGKDGVDGNDGADGAPGVDGKAPQVRINETTNEWEISLDGGVTWTSTGTLASGKDGANGRNGQDGSYVFESVNIVTDVSGNKYVEFKMKSTGLTFRVPLYES